MGGKNRYALYAGLHLQVLLSHNPPDDMVPRVAAVWAYMMRPYIMKRSLYSLSKGLYQNADILTLLVGFGIIEFV